MTKQAKPSGTDGVGQRWTTCATPHVCVGHVLTVMDRMDGSMATLVAIAFVIVQVSAPFMLTSHIDDWYDLMKLCYVLDNNE